MMSKAERSMSSYNRTLNRLSCADNLNQHTVWVFIRFSLPNTADLKLALVFSAADGAAVTGSISLLP